MMCEKDLKDQDVAPATQEEDNETPEVHGPAAVQPDLLWKMTRLFGQGLTASEVLRELGWSQE